MKNLIIVIFSFLSLTTFAQDIRENLGPAINTKENTECYPVISPDGKTLFFSRNLGGNKENDIFYSQLNENGEWGKAVELKEINDEKDNIICYIYPDGNTILLAGIENGDGEFTGILKSGKTANGWSKPVKIKFEKELSWDRPSATVSPDGKVMLLNNSNDIQVSFLKKNDTWTEPVDVPLISTTDDDFSATIAPDGKTVYYSSEGFETLGDNDIFKTVRLDDTWMNWSQPENLGDKINSEGFDNFFTVSIKGDYAYTYSLSIGGGDLLRVKLKEEEKPVPSSILINGTVYDAKTKKPIVASIHYEVLPEGSVIGEASTDPVTGKYKIILPFGKEYSLRASAKGYIPVSKNLDFSLQKTFQEINEDLYLFPVEVGQTLTLNNVFFGQGKFELLPASYPELDRLVQNMKENPTMEIEISGHTDNQGSLSLNQTLSEKRVNEVNKYLVTKGIDSKRITGKGYGGTKPIASNTSEATRKLNRRVEFTITKK